MQNTIAKAGVRAIIKYELEKTLEEFIGDLDASSCEREDKK
jgi:hypothetical protein